MEMISVIIPSYNRADTIKRSVQSVLNQTYRSFEIIIVDDDSKDNTGEIISKLNDSRISYHKNNTNRGACASRNLGIEKAKGKFIAFQDSDDEWLPEKLKEQISFLTKINCDLVFCSMERISGKKKEIYPPFTPDNKTNFFKQSLYENYTSTQTILGKREVFEKIKFDERMPRFQDWELILRISRDYNIKFIDKVLVKSYIQENSISLNSGSAVSALKIIYDIHKDTIIANKKINQRFHIKIAEYMLANGKNPKKHYKKAYQLIFSIKLFLFYIACSASLNKFLFKVKQSYFRLC